MRSTGISLPVIVDRLLSEVSGSFADVSGSINDTTCSRKMQKAIDHRKGQFNKSSNVMRDCLTR